MLAAYCFSGLAIPASTDSNDFVVSYELRTCKRPSLHDIEKSNRDGKKEYYRYPPGTVLIKTIATSICGSDLFGLGGCKSCPNWRRPTDLFAIMQKRCGGSGHEAIGKIVDIVPLSNWSTTDQNNPPLTVGQRVLAMPSTYIMKVSSMREAFEKETGLDVNLVFQEEHGAFCQYFISHQCVCLPLPESVPIASFDWRW